MNLFSYFKREIQVEIESWTGHGDLASHLRSDSFTVEPPKDSAHGDVATNAAMILARPMRSKPRDIASRLVDALADRPGIERAEVAGPGFVNIRLSDAFWRDRLGDVLRSGGAYGRADMGSGEPVNIEYVSANPTGPLHVGHARGAVLGDVLANLLAFVGYAVTREYYINDAGAQVDLLARTVHHRYLEVLGGEARPLPEGYYPGDYVIPIARTLAEEDGDRWADGPESDWLPRFRTRAIEAMMAMIRDDLGAVGIRHDVFSSERALVEAGAVRHAIAHLDEKGLLYTGVLEAPKGKPDDDWEPRPQLLFRSTAYGDDTDRPLRKSDGSWTYFASDIAYHFDKVQRGFHSLIDVLGADHGGYVKRMEAAVTAMSDGRGRLDVMLCQMVRLFDAGEPVKMSKRAGTFVSLRALVDRVGGDAVRFMLSIRRHDQALDFDLAKVTEQSRDNPIFYVQYAHARVRSVLRHAAVADPAIDLSPGLLADADLSPLEHTGETAVIRLLAQWPRTVELAARSREPHRIAYYLLDLAAAFHALWNLGRENVSLRFLASDQRAVTTARLALVSAVGIVLASGLRLFGIEPVEELRSDEPL